MNVSERRGRRSSSYKSRNCICLSHLKNKERNSEPAGICKTYIQVSTPPGANFKVMIISDESKRKQKLDRIQVKAKKRA